MAHKKVDLATKPEGKREEDRKKSLLSKDLLQKPKPHWLILKKNCLQYTVVTLKF